MRLTAGVNVVEVVVLEGGVEEEPAAAEEDDLEASLMR